MSFQINGENSATATIIEIMIKIYEKDFPVLKIFLKFKANYLC